MVWLGGIFLCLLRALWQRWLVARLLRRTTRIEEDVWKQDLANAARQLGLSRAIRLAKLDEVRTPLVAGMLRPVVVLPGDADGWDAARRRLVLLHELAHIKRRDLLTQSLAGCVCILHWFNPLAWSGLLQMRKLRELACDDLVLASGQHPADYADVLLDVARSYRQRSPAMAVGMARGTNVEHRIFAILDRARSRVALSRRAAFLCLTTAAALVVLIGSMRLATQAGPTPQQERVESAGRETTAESDDLRMMEVQITDEAGTPLAGANLHVSMWFVKGYKSDLPRNRDVQTDANGVVRFEIPRRLYILRLWPAKPGYVPEFLNFGQGTHDEGKGIPDHYKFQLAKGTELSGQVVDENGEPIKGVTVDVKVEVPEPAWGRKPDPMISTWLTDTDFTAGPVVTGEDGKWKINNAPAKGDREKFEFKLKLTHPTYVRDKEWGDVQNQQGVTTAMLRDGSARIVLSRGVPVIGTVVDAAGNPVTPGLVIWNDDPYLAEGVNETEIDAFGRFQTLPLSPGEYPVTVIAPGFRPVRRMVAVDKSMEELRFEMQPGRRLALRIVDQKGARIPGAHVNIAGWGESKAIYNWHHPNVADSRIPTQADETGLYVWDWAPDDAVSYMVSAGDYSTNTATLIATNAEHVVKLSRALVATGHVTDANTGEPVKQFRAVPVYEHRPMFLSTWFLGEIPGENGVYELKLTDRDEGSRRYRVRIDADGYRSALSEQSFDIENGRVTVDFVLEPAAAQEGLVLDTSGKPAANASVILGTPSIVPQVTNAELDWGGREIKTSDDGRFQLAATFEPVRVRVLHEAGFADVRVDPDETLGTIRLLPWARVTGRLVHDGSPVADQTIRFNPVPSGVLGEPRFQDSYYAKTDADGRFEFKRLPPITGSVRAHLGPWQDSALTSSQSAPLTLQPGERRTLALGGEGVAVTGQVVETGRGDVSLNKKWSLNYLIRRDGGVDWPAGAPPLSFEPSGPVQASWFLDQRFYDWLATRQNWFVKLAPDGRLHVSGVPAGKYDLVLRLYEQPAGCLVETIGERVIPIEITATDAVAGVKDIGPIEVECRTGPRVGENMQAYEFVDVTGRQRTIADMHGRYVLMHVWASWCAPCVEHMPDVQAAAQSLSDQPITFVGLNI
ncbi:MAG: M56 family metallopeptidase, partial [Planctomycetaceae bacterium]